jgi:MFS family permease
MVSLALMMGTMGTALASPLYPLYQALWHLVPSQITYIFVAYMFGCLATLLFLGRTSNSIGYLRTLQVGLVLVKRGPRTNVCTQPNFYLLFPSLIQWK